MSIWLVIGVAAALFVLVVALAGSLGAFNQPMAPETTSVAAAALPADFASEELSILRFTPALRGYRPDEVDAALDACRLRIAELEAQLETSGQSAPARHAPVSGEPSDS
jgi:DivIVA domain-containing protein